MVFQEQREWDVHFMEIALGEARTAFQKKEVPVGAFLVKENRIVSAAYNRVEELQDVTAHAELLCLREGSHRIGNWRLSETTLYVTLEPCSMCLGAILLARVRRLVWAAKDLRHGALGSWVNLLEKKHPTHALEVEKEVLEKESSLLLKKFFKLRREEKNGESVCGCRAHAR